MYQQFTSPTSESSSMSLGLNSSGMASSFS